MIRLLSTILLAVSVSISGCQTQLAKNQTQSNYQGEKLPGQNQMGLDDLIRKCEKDRDHAWKKYKKASARVERLKRKTYQSPEEVERVIGSAEVDAKIWLAKADKAAKNCEKLLSCRELARTSALRLKMPSHKSKNQLEGSSSITGDELLALIDEQCAADQATLANNFESFTQVLEREEAEANYRIGVTTSDSGNPWHPPASSKVPSLSKRFKFRSDKRLIRVDELDDTNDPQIRPNIASQTRTIDQP
ncbi:hypothetical protein BOW35_04260 [Solemya velum gill symbiont]|uniref:hypothetical protein n=1 Tax=Solemya velum gill symbiont TaxID=2340 RepID=UPI00099722D9|nr:hypothetical protein [Solemya velum gill symbiont]OOZ15655.1 hypothetical protein BOW27_03255 [Solemya velum gill symbiont]OOZ20467.1 hypothetical protein BOW29_02310 [Solemya velum gill symbiont]OOZ22341.1 hypothetical protein BOW30_06415 [Solemya velum gill symbiont]OOZ24617.1 hypothetical protein BOW31_05980 [Solemya velum gill symbiont]OOZ30111.1 hypothetical protein BOW33_02910 [Solemya velum gill symbiont]